MVRLFLLGWPRSSASWSPASSYPDDLVKEVTEPNQVKATSTYDKAGRLLTLTNSDAFATKSSYAYEYDPQGTGNRVKQIETNNSAPGAPAGGIRSPETTLYAYDAANRLKKVTYPQDATYPAGRVITYTRPASTGTNTPTTTRAPHRCFRISGP